MPQRVGREVSRHKIRENGVYGLHRQVPGRQSSDPHRLQPVQCEGHVGGNETFRRAAVHSRR